MLGSTGCAAAAPVRLGRRRRGARGSLVVLVAVIVVAATGCQWTQRGNGPGHGSFSSIESTLTPASVGTLDVDHRSPLPVAPLGDPVVVDGLVVTAGIDAATNPAVATVSASTAATGASTWTTTLPGAPFELSDVASDGTLVVVAAHEEDGTIVLHALDGDTGVLRWSTTVVAAPSTAGWTTLSPVLTLVGQRVVISGLVADVAGDLILLEQVVLGVDLVSGAAAWERRRPVREPRGSRVVGVASGNVAYAYEDVRSDGSGGPAYVTQVLRATDGLLVWSHDGDAGEAVVAAAAADGNRVVGDLGGSQPDGSGGVLDASAGTVVWDGAPSLVPPMVVTDTAVIWPVPDEQGVITSLRSYALADGDLQWDDALPAGTSARTASVAGSVLYLTTDDGPGLSLRTYDAPTGAPLSTVVLSPADSSETFVGTPVVVSGAVYLVIGADAGAPDRLRSALKRTSTSAASRRA